MKTMKINSAIERIAPLPELLEERITISGTEVICKLFPDPVYYVNLSNCVDTEPHLYAWCGSEELVKKFFGSYKTIKHHFFYAHVSYHHSQNPIDQIKKGALDCGVVFTDSMNDAFGRMIEKYDVAIANIKSYR